MSERKPNPMRIAVWVLAALLLVLHQDFWNWNNAGLVFGFLPVGLAYHAGYSVAAAVVWALAVKFAWPTEVEKFAEGGAPSDDDRGEGTP